MKKEKFINFIDEYEQIATSLFAAKHVPVATFKGKPLSELWERHIHSVRGSYIFRYRLKPPGYPALGYYRTVPDKTKYWQHETDRFAEKELAVKLGEIMWTPVIPRS